jgi:hypothetical protein
MNSLPHLSAIFDRLKAGGHIGPDDEPEFSALSSPRFDEYAAYFAALGLTLIRHEREFFYFEPENPEKVPDTLAAMIAYVQEGTPQAWDQQIGDWIRTLAQDFPSEWSLDDLLHESGNATGEVFRLQSQHARMTQPEPIALEHLWLSMN